MANQKSNIEELASFQINDGDRIAAAKRTKTTGEIDFIITKNGKIERKGIKEITFKTEGDVHRAFNSRFAEEQKK